MKQQLRSAILTVLLMIFGLGLFGARVCAQSGYVISGSPDGTADFVVDDRLAITINGVVAYDDGPAARAGSRHYIPFPQLKPGDVLGFRVYDTIGYCSSLTPLYLTCSPGGSVVAAPGFDQGCGHGGGDRELQYTYSSKFRICARASV